MCTSPSSLGNCTIYSTSCIMIYLVIPILSLIQSLYSLSKLQFFFIYLSLVLFLLLLVITLDIEHLNTCTIIIYNTIGTSKHQKYVKDKYTSQEQNLFNFTVPLHVLQQAPVLIHVHLHSWLGLMTSEPKGLMTKSSQGENLFPCNKFTSSSILILYVAMTCIIMYCRSDMHIRTERVN